MNLKVFLYTTFFNDTNMIKKTLFRWDLETYNSARKELKELKLIK